MFHLATAVTPDDRMAALEEFLEWWLGPRRDDYGEPAEALDAVALPAPLRRLYAFAGRWPEPPSHLRRADNALRWPDWWVPLSELRTDDGKLAFCYENQGCGRWGTLHEGADPPVWWDYDQRGEWALMPDRLSHFLVTYCLRTAARKARKQAHDPGLAAHYQSRRAAAVPLWSGQYTTERIPGRPSEPVRYFLLDGQILVEEGGETWPDRLLFAANSPEGVAHFDALLAPVREIGLTLHPGPDHFTGRYWLFVLYEDGSGRLAPRGRLSATFPPGTADFRRLRQHLLALPAEENAPFPHLFLDLHGPGSTHHIHKRSSDLTAVRELFPRVLPALEGEEGAELRRTFAEERPV